MAMSDAHKQIITLFCLILFSFCMMWWYASSASYAHRVWKNECGTSELSQCIKCDTTVSIQACADGAKTFTPCYTQHSNYGHCRDLEFIVETRNLEATIMYYLTWFVVVFLIKNMCDIFQTEWHRMRAEQHANRNGSLYEPLASQEQPERAQPMSNYIPFTQQT